MADGGQPDRRAAAVADYRKKLLEHKEIDATVRKSRDEVKTIKKEYDKTEDDLKALQSVGQIIGEVLRQLDEERCESLHQAPLVQAVKPAAALPHPQLCLWRTAHRFCPLLVPACSHRQGQQRATLRCGLPSQGRQGQADQWPPRHAGHDHLHHHAHPAPRGAPAPPWLALHLHLALFFATHAVKPSGRLAAASPWALQAHSVSTIRTLTAGMGLCRWTLWCTTCFRRTQAR